MTSRITRVALGATALALTAGGMVATTSSAHAATARDGVCESGEFCLSYNSGFTGSVSDFNTSVDDYGTTQPSCYEFKSAGNGQGVCVKNNAASARNLTGAAVTVYYNSGYAGASQTIPAGATVDLNATLKNQNASHQLGTAPTGGVTGATAAARARTWVDAHVGYSQTSTYNGYRKDCSGFVSMAWGLAAPGLTTVTMPSVGSYTTKDALRRGDALLASGHVVLFDAWADSSHSSYWGYEETPSVGATYRKIPYPYFSGYGTFRPFHYSRLG